MNVCTYSISNRTISAGTLSVFSQRLQKLNGCCFSVNSCDENNYLTDILLEKIVSYLKVNVKMVLRHLEQNIRPRANEMMEVKTTVCKKKPDNLAHCSNAILQAGGIWTGISSDQICSIIILKLRTVFE